MGSFKNHPYIETDQQYRGENPTDILARIESRIYISIIISTLSCLMSFHMFFLILYIRRQIQKMKEITERWQHIIDIISQGKNTPNNNTNAVSESVRQNIQLIESDLMVSESNIVDELQTYEYLTEEAAKTMKLRNRSDQAHLFAEILEVTDENNFLRIVDILKRCSFKHIADSLQSSYEDVRKTQVLAITSLPMCPICRLKYQVDIKDLRCELKKEELLPFSLYVDINSCLAGKGQQNYLWKKLLSHLRHFESESVENKFIKMFDTPRHQGLYECFMQKFPTHFECSCLS